VTLLGGEPGVGKSTLGLQVAGRVQQGGRKVLYVSGEESPAQIRLRADRLESVPGAVRLLAETRVEALLRHWDELAPDLVLIDSIQTMQCDRVESAPGSVAQVRESAALLAAAARRTGAVLLLIGHVTKDGSLAGPRLLEHLVDVVLDFEGDRDRAFRLLRASKNRFGSTQEVGVFRMEAGGLVVVENPSEHFLAERSPGRRVRASCPCSRERVRCSWKCRRSLPEPRTGCPGEPAWGSRTGGWRSCSRCSIGAATSTSPRGTCT
jgi:DNA repair protein RadA/Sms